MRASSDGDGSVWKQPRSDGVVMLPHLNQVVIRFE
jgi:hypothetical protein